jgi:transposase-like protein
MTGKKVKAGAIDVKALLAGDEEFLRALVRTALQEAPGAEKGERTAGRLGYRSGYYGRTLITRIASSSCACRRTGSGGSQPSSSNATNSRTGRW